MLAVKLRSPVMMELREPTPLREMLCAETTVKFCRGVVNEKASGTVASPVPAVIVTEWAPSRSVPKVISPFVVLSARSPSRLMGPEKIMVSPVVVVVITPPIFEVPAPVWLKEPLSKNVALEGVVREEESVTANGPPPVVVTCPCREKEVPVRLMPRAPLVLRAPKVVDPASCEMLAAVIAPVVFDTPEVIVRAPIGVFPPTADASVIDPASAARDRLLSPSTVLERSILPVPEPVLSADVPVRVIALAKERLAFALVMVPLRWTAPPPLWVKAPASMIVPPIV